MDDEIAATPFELLDQALDRLHAQAVEYWGTSDDTPVLWDELRTVQGRVEELAETAWDAVDAVDSDAIEVQALRAVLRRHFPRRP